MTATFNSSRDAVAYALARSRGPQAARPSMGRTPGGYRSEWDGSAVRGCMVRAGVAKGSPEEREFELWVQKGGAKPALERALRVELDAHGLLRRPEPAMSRADLVDVVWVDPETGEEEVLARSVAREGDE